MENIIKTNEETTTPSVATQNEVYVKTKAYQDFINVLSQIIEKHGTEVLDEINRIV